VTGLYDSFQRPINYLRISVTDRCNLRCIYCMPAGGVSLMSHDDILTYEEINTVALAAARLGINKIRLTGGEPLVRPGLAHLVEMLSQINGIDDISLTTNGILLSKYAAELKSAGLKRVNISLDTLKTERFTSITRLSDRIDDVLEGIDAAISAGLYPVKINCVVMAGINDDEIPDFAGKTINDGWNVRFIELMPVNGDKTTRQWFVPVSMIRKRIESLGTLESCLSTAGNGPAKYFRFPDAEGTIGFITPVSEHFCFRCNRLRLTSDGKLRPCLLAEEEIDLKQSLRTGTSIAGIMSLIEEAVARKPLGHRLSEGYVPEGRPFSRLGG